MLDRQLAEVLRLGLLRFPNNDAGFPGRHGNTKQYLIDTRGAGTNIPLRTAIVNRLQARMNEARKNSGAIDVIAGLSKSGTVWGAWLAWHEQLPFANVLPEPRMAGLQRQVEGEIESKSVMLVDNWIRTGTSIAVACSAIRKAGGNVSGVLAIVAHPSVVMSEPLYSCWGLTELLNGAVELGLAPQDIQVD